MDKSKPILFSAPMIRAILCGAKTQTRRVMKPQPKEGWIDWLFRQHGGNLYDRQGNKRLWVCDDKDKEIHCPYGKPGDQLWVRETWAAIWPDLDPVPLRECKIEYRADDDAAYPGGWPAEEAKGNDDAPKWRPSIFMPKWASRITLEVTGVKVERVGDITDDDAIQEGVDRTNTSIPTYAIQRFQKLWDSINGDREGCSWADNPVVWVISFRRMA